MVAAVVASVAVVVGSGATTAVAIVVVGAEEFSPEPVVSDGQPANSNARPGVEVPAELASLATSLGQAWSQTYMRQLQDQERDIVGAWPGTIREARRQVLARIKDKLEPEQLDQLARIANLAARRIWETVSEPDLEA
ncbi:MAG TPA: hypothetical protein VFS15_15005 [Kofleriaceae bacterium]|nr:hypothetical protein [Kofleriaceae bacterium]